MRNERLDAERSEVFWSTDFEVKWGVFGSLIGFLFMRPMMKSVLNKLLKGLAYYSATGEAIETNLPSEDELKLAIG